MGTKKAVAKTPKNKTNPIDRLIAIITGSISIAVIIALIVFLFMNSLLDKGFFARKTVAVNSDSYTVNNVMMSYYFYEEYRMFIDCNYDDIADMNLSTEKPLKKQDCPLIDGSWHDYFLDLTIKTVKENLYLAEIAQDNGISLADEEKEEIDFLIGELQAAAENSNQTTTEYYAFLYGRGVLEDDIRDCMSLTMLADKCKETLYDQLEISDSEFETAFKEIKQENTYADVAVYTFKNPENAKGLSDYKSLATAATLDTLEDYDDISLEIAETFITGSLKNTYKLGESDKVDELFFEGDGQVDKVYTFEDDGVVTAYALMGEIYRNEDITKNVCAIYFDNESYKSSEYAASYASSAYQALEEADFSLLRFEHLADKYSTDNFQRYNGGRYRNLDKLSTDFDSYSTEWIFDESRVAGDCTVIEGEDGYYLVYFEGDGLPAWQAAAKESIFENYLNELYSQYDDIIEINQKKLNRISL